MFLQSLCCSGVVNAPSSCSSARACVLAASTCLCFSPPQCMSSALCPSISSRKPPDRYFAAIASIFEPTSFHSSPHQLFYLLFLAHCRNTRRKWRQGWPMVLSVRAVDVPHRARVASLHILWRRWHLASPDARSACEKTEDARRNIHT